jgi:competence protein ComEC
MRPSAMRAGTFFLVLSVARLLQYKVDYSNAVCFAGAVLLVLSPGLAWDLGFRLSIGAVFGMTLLLPAITSPARRAASGVAKVRFFIETGLLVSFSAQVLTVPLILWSFGRVSIIAGVANLFVLPVMSLALTAGIEGAVFAAILPGLGSVFMRSASLLVVAGISIAEALGRCVNPLVYAGRPHAAHVGAYYAVVVWLGLFERRLGRRAKLALLGAAFALMLVRIPHLAGGPDKLEITFLYVGNGDACVMELPGGQTWLVDTGPASSDYDAAAAVVLPFLALRGIGAIDGLVVTHSHNDHCGGIPTLIENIEVGEILVGTTAGEEPYRADLDDARRSGVPVRCALAGETWERGGVRFEVLHPGGAGGPGLDVSRLPGGRDNPNAWSMVIKATFGERSVLITGDLTPAVQDSLVARGVDLSCDVLKVPHHGHPGETSAVFAGALGARLAVISCGTKYFDEPDSTTAALLERAGMRVLSTRTDGAVQVSTDGRDLSVCAVLGSP